jgi:beta-N-acetylhexosaminidase
MQFSFENISFEQKIGQMIMVGFPGLELEPSHFLIPALREGLIGGLIFFDKDIRTNQVRNIESPNQVKSLISQILSISRFPLFLAVDEEGGKVARLSSKNGFPDFPSHSEIGSMNDGFYTRNVASQIASLLEETGFNTNFAPVIDIAINPHNAVIVQKERSFSDIPETVVEHSAIFIEEHIRRDILPVAKHFPGHGSSEMDSHLGWTDVTRTWQPLELKPYELLQAKALLPAVMVAHIYNSAFDSNFPASLSHIWIEEILRKEIGFSGVVFSDDLQMKAISDNFAFEESIEFAINAGVDVLLFANQLDFDPGLHNRILRTILKLVKSDKISIQRIEESFLRIKSIKQKNYVKQKW